MKTSKHPQLGYLFIAYLYIFPKELKTNQTSLAGYRLELVKK